MITKVSSKRKLDSFSTHCDSERTRIRHDVLCFRAMSGCKSNVVGRSENTRD